MEPQECIFFNTNIFLVFPRTVFLIFAACEDLKDIQKLGILFWNLQWTYRDLLLDRSNDKDIPHNIHTEDNKSIVTNNTIR